MAYNKPAFLKNIVKKASKKKSKGGAGKHMMPSGKMMDDKDMTMMSKVAAQVKNKKK